ncbi:MAG: hypothetical protein KGL38_10170 [Gemmatimonadota bacterium]|nr:hypothetical protein [Gemmatimonadota bacterium]MDE3173284.1 hypothetical protein [Gemmatimonadota bacterium]
MSLPRSVRQWLAGITGLIDRSPSWARPTLIGAAIGLIGLGVGLVNFLIALPYVIVETLRGRMSASAGDLRSLGELAVLYVGGFAAAGSVYSLIGRPLRRIPRVGELVAAVVCLFPCTLILGRTVDHLDDGLPLLAPLTHVEIGLASFMAALFGGALAYGRWRARRRWAAGRAA